jgi:hypothetical protein
LIEFDKLQSPARLHLSNIFRYSMTNHSISEAGRSGRDSVFAVLIPLGVFLILWFSPVHQVTDSAYSMLLSESLLHHGSFELNHYAIPRGEPSWVPAYYRNGEIYQLELVDGRLYYHLSPGTSILSVPFVAVLNAFGVSAANPDNSYNAAGEEKIESILAAILMALLAGVFFQMARLLLPLAWSVVISLGGILGTQIWSSASRAMWNETWGTLLLGIVLWLLLKQAITKRVANQLLLGTLVSWMYFVRPTYSVHILAITVYLILTQRKRVLSYLLTGGVWLAAFMIYSWRIYHALLPSYYKPGRLHFAAVWSGLAGNLFSPSRGLLVCVPIVLFIIWLLLRYRRTLVLPWLTVAGLFVIATHLFATSATLQWWGGHAFGARFTTGLVPWFVLLAVLGVHATIRAHAATPAKRARGRQIEVALGCALLLISVVVNGSGALNRATWKWNTLPLNIDQHPERLWDWRQPQFLAGLINPPLPDTIPPLKFGVIDFSQPESDSYLWYGWSTAETEYRWTEQKDAALVFFVRDPQPIRLTVKFLPFIVPNKIKSQRVTVFLNDRRIDEFTAAEPAPGERFIKIPVGALQLNNVLRFVLPDAASPTSFGLSGDERLLGIAVSSMKFEGASDTQ